MIYLCFLFFFFFFKQKTAYEMRISDWSSDVCSSDLIVDAEVVVWNIHFLLADQLPCIALGRAIETVVVVDRAKSGGRHRIIEADFRCLAHAPRAGQIGRAHV